MSQPTRRAARVVQGPDGEPQVTLEGYTDAPVVEDDETYEEIPLLAGEDKITVKHTYCYVAGNQTQYTTCGVELAAGPEDTAETLFARAQAIATNGVMLAADALTESINERRGAARNS